MNEGRSDRAAWTPLVVLLSGLVFTAAVTAYVSSTARLRDELRFTSAVRDLRGSLDARIDTYIALLRATSALFAAHGTVERRGFAQFVEHLDLRHRSRGIQGIGYAPRVWASDLSRFEAHTRKELPKFRVTPPEPRRDVYYPILLLEPLDARNQAALGYDMHSEATRMEAMREAMSKGVPVASGRVRLVQEIDHRSEQSGFLIYLPVYEGGGTPYTTESRESALLGFVYSPFRAGDLFNAVLTAEDRRLLAVRVYDGTLASPARLLFASGTPDASVGRALQQTLSMRVLQRPWMLVIEARQEFGGTSPLLVPGIFFIGLGTSIMLFLLTRAEARARHRAEATADALRRSEEELQVAGRAKDEFLATLSHELRTPLNAIMGWTRLLRMGHLDESRQAGALEIVERNARAQAQLIEDLLDVSRIITGKLRLDLRMVAVNRVLDDAVTTLRPAADAKGVTLEWTAHPAAGAIYAAPDRLQQIAWNLLSNAIKFTPAGGQVELATERSAEALCIVVRDTGIGIAPNFLPHVFERFRQADSTTTRAHSGVGLGLAIVRHLVELHGGTIDAASDGPGRGATFTVRFPVHRVDATTVASGAPGERSTSATHGAELDRLRVLVVDDEADARALVANALVAHGAQVRAAGSVAEAMLLLEDDDIDLVVTDLAMPYEDGFGLVDRLRSSASRHLRVLPVVALTAYARAEDRERVMARGFQGFLAKPLEVEQLTRLVAALARRE